ncbi:MAG: glutaminyl-peptide cyclotransferase, partial [Gemmatimonadaceae bacterium]
MRRIQHPSRATLASSVALVALLFTTTAAACSSDKTDAGATPAPGVTSTRTPTYTFEVVRKYPHDPTAYTEG